MIMPGQTEIKINDSESNDIRDEFKNLELNVFKYDFALSFAKQDRLTAEGLFNLLKDNSRVFYLLINYN